MAALATRFIRIAVAPGFAASFRSAGTTAGSEFFRAFKVRVAAALSTFTPRVKVKVDLDFSSFRAPILPPINLRVGFDMTSAIAAGRHASAVANAAAGPINLGVSGSGFGNIVNTFINSGIQTISQQFGNITNNASSAANSVSNLGSSLGDLGGSAGQALGIARVVFIIAAIPEVVMASIAAIYALGGALGSIPALTVGLGASIGVFKLGFAGIAEHLQATGKAGGGAAKSMSAVNNAMRSLARAQRDLTKATKEIDKARADEIERIDDLGRALRGAYLDEEDAVSAVAEARTKLAEARGSGDVNAIGEADRAYRRSLLTLDEARDKTGDLQQDQDKAAKDGVEGSDAMQQAYERQRDAVESVRAAEEALAEARKSAGGGGAAALMKLAPAAQEVVDKLKALKPAFEEVRLAVQQTLFTGVAPELQRLANAWKKPLKDTLVSYAGTFNGLFKTLGESVRNQGFIDNITAGADSVRRNLAKVGDAVAGPLVDAFGRLAAAATPFIDMLGDKISGMVEHFSAWIKSADDSGDLTKFFQDAAYYLGQIWDIGGSVVGIIGDIFGIMFDTKDQGGTRPWLEGLNEELVIFREWMKDPENQKKIKDFVNRIGELVAQAQEFTTWVLERGLPALSQLIDNFQKTKDKIDEWLERWKKVREAVGSPFDVAPGMFDGIADAMRRGINKAIDIFNSLDLGIKIGVGPTSVTGNIKGLAPKSGGVAAGLGPRKLAVGGVARATPGGIQATIAEGGKDEVVSPVEVMQDYVRTAVREANADSAAGPGGDIVNHVYIGQDLVDTIVVKAVDRNRSTVAKSVNAGNKRLGYAG